MKTIFLMLTLAVAAHSAGVSVIKVEQVPTLAPACKCDKCQCDPCKCVAPLVSVKAKHTPTEASVKVRSTKADGRSYPYSGTAICDHTVITCAHGLGNEFDKVTIDGKPARVLHIMRDLDVALIQTEHELKPVSVAKSWPKAKESVTGYGYEAVNKGVLWYYPSRVLETSQGGKYDSITILNRASPGRSGGGLFNDAGELVGVCRGFYNEANSSIYSGLDSVRKIIGEPCEFNTVKETPPKFQSVIDPLKYSAPDFNVQAPNSCPDGRCPLQKQSAPSCVNGNCSKAPAKVVPAPVRRSGFLRGRR